MSKVKLIPNLDDNSHCFQACFAMVYETLLDTPVSMETSERLTGYVEDMPTWAYQGILNWADKGLYVKYIENFSHSDFVKDPETTIRNHVNNEEIAKSVIEASDFEKEVRLVNLCFANSNVTFEVAQPSLDDIKNYICSGALVVVNVNYYALLEPTEKYVGHFVVVEDIDDSYITLQNPGLPPIANQKVKISDFLRAWYYPNEKLANMIVVSSNKI